MAVNVSNGNMLNALLTYLFYLNNVGINDSKEMKFRIPRISSLGTVYDISVKKGNLEITLDKTTTVRNISRDINDWQIIERLMPAPESTKRAVIKLKQLQIKANKLYEINPMSKIIHLLLYLLSNVSEVLQDLPNFSTVESAKKLLRDIMTPDLLDLEEVVLYSPFTQELETPEIKQELLLVLNNLSDKYRK